MRSKVVLPQPLGPTNEMNAPRSMATLISRRTSSSPKRLVNPLRESFAITASTPRPRHQQALDPGKAGCHRDPRNSEDDHAGKQLRHVEGISRLADESA